MNAYFVTLYSSKLFPLFLFVGLVIIVLIALIFRELFSWFWKINEVLRLLRQIDHNTRRGTEMEEKVLPHYPFKKP